MTRALAWIALVSLGVACALAAPASAKQYTIYRDDDYRFDASTLRGLRFRVTDPEMDLRIGGRLHVDGMIADDDTTSIDDDAEVRRGRIYLSGDVLDDFSFKVEYDFADDRSGWKNVWVRYRPTRGVSIKGGNFVAPFGSEDVSSSNYSILLERALSAAIAPSFQTGLELQTRGRFRQGWGRSVWTWAVAGTTAPFDDHELDRHKSNHWAVSSRGTIAPLAKRRRLVRFGASVEYRDVDGDSDFRYRTRTETGIGPALLNTGRLASVDHVVSVGAEAAVMVDSLTLEAEYMRGMLTRQNLPDPEFDGWYAQAAYVLTGEVRRYSRSSGSFRGIDPKHWWGAVEAAFRYSRLDLNDATVTGGKATDYTVGLNWYLRRNLRLMFNYVRVDGQNSAQQNDDPQFYEMRLALFF